MQSLESLEASLAKWSEAIATAKSREELDPPSHEMATIIIHSYDFEIHAKFSNTYRERLLRLHPRLRGKPPYPPELVDAALRRQFIEELGIDIPDVRRSACRDAFLQWRIRQGAINRVWRLRQHPPSTERLLEFLHAQKMTAEASPEEVAARKEEALISHIGTILGGFDTDEQEEDEWRRYDGLSDDEIQERLEARGLEQAWMYLSEDFDDGWEDAIESGALTDRISELRSKRDKRWHEHTAARKKSLWVKLIGVISFVNTGPQSLLDSDSDLLERKMAPAIRATKSALEALRKHVNAAEKAGRIVRYRAEPITALTLALCLLRHLYPVAVDDAEREKLRTTGREWPPKKRSGVEPYRIVSSNAHLDIAVDTLRSVGVPHPMISEYLLGLGYGEKEASKSAIATRASRLRAAGRATHAVAKPGRPKGSGRKAKKPSPTT